MAGRFVGGDATDQVDEPLPTGPLEQAGRYRGAIAAGAHHGQRPIVGDFVEPAWQCAARDVDGERNGEPEGMGQAITRSVAVRTSAPCRPVQIPHWHDPSDVYDSQCSLFAVRRHEQQMSPL